jgi:hypothetical protein
MPDKRRERLYVEQLRAVLSDFPLGNIEGSESPDFIIGAAVPATTGIEVTQFSFTTG